MLNNRKLKTGNVTSRVGMKLIEYKEGETIVIAHEFSIFNTDDSNSVKLLFNEDGDVLELEPGEGFETSFGVKQVTVVEGSAKIKYTYWR